MTIRHPFTHENLDCYRLAVEVNRWFDGASFPRGRSHLRDQGLRAIDSVVVNIAEGVARQAVGAKRNHLDIALASAAEACASLEPVAHRVTEAPDQQAKLRRVGAMLGKMRR